MTSKHLALLVSVLVLVAGIAWRLGAQQEIREANLPCQPRYALVQGEYLYIPSKGSGLNERGIFRIDTMTGQTWRFVFRDTETYWDPIDVVQPKTRR